MIGAPRTLPNPKEIDLGGAWAVYFGSAPLHVRVGFDVAAVVIGVVAPGLMGCGATLVGLDDATRDRVLRRVASWPLGEDLVQVAKAIVCLVYFGHEGVEDAARETRP